VTGNGGDAVRAAVLVAQPIQHFAPGLRLLAQRPEVHTRVYYWNAAAGGLYDPGFGRHVRWSTDLHSGYDWWAPPAGRPAVRRQVAVWRRLRTDRPDAILCFGWASRIARAGIAYATLTRTPLLYYGDTNGRAPLGGGNQTVRALVLRRLFGGAAGAVSTGTFNREFYLAHGLPPERIHAGVYPTDVDLFHAAANQRRPNGGEGRPLVIGFAGKFTPIKAAQDLVEAVARLPDDLSWELRLIGDGPLRPQLEAAVATHGLTGRVHFLGFRNTDELPALMSEIDIMVMPSRKEPRGLVPIEAMAAGAAVVVSSATGVWGPGDAVQQGETGLVYPAGDIDALAACLRRLMDQPDLRLRLAAAGRARARSFGPHEFASTVAAALVATARPTRSTFRAQDARGNP
jgi:glycosyltransferase involved in cell wall biosynthesis